MIELWVDCLETLITLESVDNRIVFISAVCHCGSSLVVSFHLRASWWYKQMLFAVSMAAHILQTCICDILVAQLGTVCAM